MVLNRRRGSRVPAAHLAGWLFADLLLVLFLLALSAQTTPEPPPEEPPPPPKLLSPESCEFVLKELGSGFEVDEDRTADEITRILADPDPGDFNTGDGHGAPGSACREHLAEEREVGFVIAFGGGSKQQIGQAKEFAADVVDTAVAHHPQFADAKYRELWTDASPGTVELSLFFLEVE